jgi:hypothetical protein
MKYIIVFLCVLTAVSSGLSISFQLPFRPLERFRYRTSACGMSLKRTTKAVLKKHTYTGCLKGSLAALYRPDSRLSKHFQRTYDLKNRQYKTNYDADLKFVFMRALKDRLGVPDHNRSVFDKDMTPTSTSRDAFQRKLGKFCRHGKVMGSLYAQERVSRIISGLQHLDMYALFDGFQNTLRVAEAFGEKDPDALKSLNRLRGRFLSILNQMAVLKKALAGKKLREGVNIENVIHLVVVNTKWIDSYAKVKVYGLMSKACQRDKSICDRTFGAMDQLASIIQSFEDLKKVCWVR